jgi:BolA protein
MRVSEQIRTKIAARLKPLALEVIDQSHKHQGHAGHRPGGESHFDVAIVSEAFEGLNRVARQRLVYQILADELKGPVHALSLELKSPAEALK